MPLSAPEQVKLIKECCAEVLHLPGDAAEIGVHKGETAELICQHLPGARVYLFDTFRGMPKEMVLAGVDGNHAGTFNDTSVDAVRKKLAAYKASITLVPGVFPISADSLRHLLLKFVHVDCDLYLSTKAALEWSWELLAHGGVILDDDYGCASCMGAKKAVDEFVAEHNAVCEVRLHRAIIRRPSE